MGATDSIKAEEPALTAAASALQGVATSCADHVSVVKTLHSAPLADASDVAAAWSRFVDVHGAFLTVFATNAASMRAALVKAGVIYTSTDTKIGTAAGGGPVRAI
ncbi:MAG: hypothetical protein ACR2FF_09195 [Mycobacteriales bacterium]|nr:MAG: hypothetical protein DLM56_00680 [Pseudonocardiales bacterium]